MNVLLGVISLFALLSLVVAVIQGMAVLRLAPAHERLASFMPLGWWKFRQLAAKAGPSAAEPLNIYKRAVIAFLVFLVLGMILSGWTINQRPSAPATTALAPKLTDTIDYAFSSDLRRVAVMPGALILRS